ncbi:carbon starvation protein A [Geobacter sp. FeAm09]|uniref:carbon starvation CstA family protein n=1 Tax=Geobacter sp. FeAm09 TaxID=2597769 RepID=UPI0011EFF225|nr:carbon starvation protein A [Geobacter sp. FeAm09]QEM67740.1 carbon starvation protein A [Geobacter sp. FeAm09]
MSVLYLLVSSLCILALAYRYYAAFIAARVLMLDDRNVTPAVTCNDGKDYVPTNKWVVFGHHFAAIAGAGPLIGPTLAAQYGWGPGFFWILLGSVFAGCLHDMIILFASVRHQGQSLAVIAHKDVSRLTGITTAFVTLFIIIVALAGLAVAVANALFNNPWGVFIIAMTIPIAMIAGVYMFRIRPGAILSGTTFGVVAILAAVYFGGPIAESSFAGWFTFSKQQLSILLPLYGFCAAALPVWLLLAPRDYLSTYMKIAVIGGLAVGLFFVNPTVQMPFATRFIAGGGPIIPGPVWPYVFITIACGAISGFHALIGSGTTPKMLEREGQVRLIGYGAMLTEAFIGVMALLAAVTLVPNDYFAINSSAAAFAKLNMPVQNLPELCRLVGLDVAHRPGGAISLAVGMAYIFSHVGAGLQHTMKYWFQFVIMFEALFILTTIDAGTRVARYILQDILGNLYAPLKQTDWVPGVVLTSGAVSFAWGYILYTGDVSSIWPMFGVTNQTLAALALAIGTTIILRISPRKRYALITLVPCAFITVTTFAAGFMNIRLYLAQGMMLNTVLSVVIIVLVTVIIVENLRVWLALLKTEKPLGMNDEREHIYCPVVPAHAPDDLPLA